MAAKAADPKSTTRQCPYCMEQIKSDAIRCKHCASTVAPERPTHGGTCSYCKETIHPEAVKCKHCQAFVDESRSAAALSAANELAFSLFSELRYALGAPSLNREPTRQQLPAESTANG
jgi:predicted amidophosphoribosyltransferase